MDKLDVVLLERIIVGSVAITERAIAAAGTDLTFVQWRVLLIVGERPEGATVSEIAGRIGARGSPASRLISRLKARRVVSAKRDPADGRVVRIVLTAEGRALRRRVLEQRRRDLDALVTAIGPTELEREVLAKVGRALDSFG